jgi:putative FmdB family regulatory protein
MPIREYKCKKCGNIFENLEIDLKDGNVICPNCKSKNAERIFSLFLRSGPSKSSCDLTKRFG